MAASNIVTLTADNFKAEVLDSSVPVLVDFWAEWCGPCKMLMPVLNELADELSAKMRIGKVDVEAQQSLAAEYRVQSIPTLILFKGGQPVEQMVGAKRKQELIAKLTPSLG